jgi:hypothetical protein
MGGNLGGGGGGSSGGSAGAFALAELLVNGGGGITSNPVPTLGDPTFSQVVLAAASPPGLKALLAFTDHAGAGSGIEIAAMDVANHSISPVTRIAKTYPGASQISAAASGDIFLLAYTEGNDLIELVTIMGPMIATVPLNVPAGVANVIVAGGSNTFLVCWTGSTGTVLECSMRRLDGSLENAVPAFMAAFGTGNLDSLSMAYVSGTYAIMYHDTATSTIGAVTVAEGTSQSNDIGFTASQYSAAVIAARQSDFVYVLVGQSATQLLGGILPTTGGVAQIYSLVSFSSQQVHDPALSCDGVYCAACWYASGISGNNIGCGQIDTGAGLSSGFGSTETVYNVPGSMPEPFQPALLELPAPVLVLPPPGSAAP